MYPKVLGAFQKTTKKAFHEVIKLFWKFMGWVVLH